MNMKEFTLFCSDSLVSCIHSYDVSDGKLYGKDASFELPPNSLDFETYGKLRDFQKAPTEDVFKSLPMMFIQKLSTTGLNNSSVTLEQLLKISDKFGTTKVSVSGDGSDYQLSEVTSDHSSEVILQVELDNKEHILSSYHKWVEQHNPAKVAKKKTM